MCEPRRQSIRRPRKASLPRALGVNPARAAISAVNQAGQAQAIEPTPWMHRSGLSPRDVRVARSVSRVLARVVILLI
jgi:hypothetical protein